MKPKRFKRFCRKCDKMFIPSGRDCRVCDDCKDKYRKSRMKGSKKNGK